MPVPAGSWTLSRRALRLGLVAARAVVGRRAASLRSMADYLILLTDQGRHAEVDALLRQGLRKLRPRRAAGNRWSPARDPLRIDAATRRLDASGAIVAKTHVYRFPSHEVPCLVSVVIPCFNYGRYLGEAIQSCRAQTLSSVEIVIVDDGSTDPETIALLDHLEGEKDLVVVRQANAGLPEARNTGIARAHGEFICCLDADDVLVPTYLETMVALHAADSSVGFAYSHVCFFGDVEEVWKTRDFDPETALTGNFTSVAALFRRDDWAEVGGYSGAMRGGFEDWEFWIRLASLGRRGRVAEVPLFRHRRHGLTMTHDAKAMEEELRARIRSLNPAFFVDREVRRRIGRLAPVARPSVSDFSRGLMSYPRDSKEGGCLLVIVPWLKLGGAELFLLAALGGIANDRRIVILTTRVDEHPLAGAFSALTGDIFHLPEMLSPDDWPAFVEALVASRRIDQVLTSGSTFGLTMAAALKRRVPAMRTLSLIHNHAPDTPFRTTISNAGSIDGFLAVSSSVERALAGGGVPVTKLWPVANGVDAEGLFRPDGAAPAEARRRLGLKAEVPLLLWVGRMAEEKRPLSFLDVVEEVARTLDVQGVLIGRGPLAEAVDARIAVGALAGRVVRIDGLDQGALPGWYAASDMTVLTSSIEGMPGAILESLAMGCPVATTDVGDVGLVVRSGENGISVPAAAPRSLAPLILEAFRDSRFATRRPAIRAAFLRTRFVRSAMIAEFRAALSGTASSPGDIE